MIDVDPTFAAWMDSGVTSARRWDLLTITLATGTILRYTDRDLPITLPDGRTFASGPLITRSRMTMMSGLEVDTLTLTIKAQATHLVDAVPLIQQARTGAFRGATVLLEWAYFDQLGTYKGVMPRFAGTGSPVALDGAEVELEVRSELERLQQQMPRDLYQPTCLNTVYDPLCGADRAAKRVTGTVATAANRSSFTTALAQATGWFDRGNLRFTSGPNTGHQRTVRKFASGQFDFALPFPYAIGAGNTFEVWPGCDGTRTDCDAKFHGPTVSQLRFRGQPYIPAPETTT